MKPYLLCLCMLFVMLFGAANAMAHQQSEQLGQVHFAVSCSAAAQPQFDRAVALLHSFWYSEAVKTFSAVTAAEREDATEKHPVTPGPIMPAREFLGDLLLELHDPAQALQAFEASMQKEPNRFNGLYGAARAAELAGDKDKAKRYYDQLVVLCEHSDTARPELQHARAFLAQK